MLDYLNYRAADTRYDDSAKMYKCCGDSGVLLPKISLGLWKGFFTIGSRYPYRPLSQWNSGGFAYAH